MKIEQQILQGESETLEFKESTSEWKEIVKTVSGFANTNGGIILIGITDKGIVSGVQIGNRTIEDLANKIKENTDPKIFARISVEDIQEKKIIVITINQNKSKPVFAFDKVYKRIGKSTVRVTSEEIRKMALEGKKTYWDEQIIEGASLKDIDEEKVKWFLRKAKTERSLDIELEISIKEALERLKLVTEGRLTNVSILLFGKEVQRFFIQAEVRCARFKGTEPSKPFIDMKIFRGDIINQVNKSLNFVLEHTPLTAWLVPGKVEREERYNYPPEAIREAIVNAICHRDYESPANVQIRIFDDRIEIWNPGSLPEGWTVERLKQTHESIPKNPLIANQFFLIKYIEKWGTGTIEMIKKCREWGLPDPDFEATGTSLIVTFRKSKLTKEYLEKLELNERQSKVIDYLREFKKLSSRKYANLFGITDRTARNDLNVLIRKGIVLRKGSSDKNTYYTLAEI